MGIWVSTCISILADHAATPFTILFVELSMVHLRQDAIRLGTFLTDRKQTISQKTYLGQTLRAMLKIESLTEHIHAAARMGFQN